MIQSILLIIASYLALFFSAIILLKKNKHISDYYLAVWLLALSAYMILLEYLPTFDVFGLIHSVFLFLYIRSITVKSGLSIKELLYFLPILFMFFIELFYSASFSVTVFNLLKIIIPVTFIIGSYFHLQRYQTYLKKNYADIEYADMNWLYLLFYGNSFFYMVAILSNFFHLIPEKTINAITLFLFMNITGLKAIKQHVIFIKRTAEYTENEKTDSKTYANYGLKGTDAEVLARNLQLYMESKKPYINQELSLNDISKALDIYSHYITQILSTVFHQNFYDFVNTYRVEEAKKQLLNDKNKHLTILAIAYNCGFNSKSSFNRVFKQKTGITPSEFLKSSK